MTPCVRYSTTNMIMAEPTTAMSSGGWPSMMAAARTAAVRRSSHTAPANGSEPVQNSDYACYS